MVATRDRTELGEAAIEDGERRAAGAAFAQDAEVLLGDEISVR